MKRINLMNISTPLWKKIAYLIPYIAIPVAIALGVHAWGQYSTINRLEDRIEKLYDAREADHHQFMQKYLELEKQLVTKVEKGKEESKVIQIDIGKTIKEFNSDVKATKEISTASDSTAALHDAWNK